MKVNIECLIGSVETIEDEDRTMNNITVSMNNDSDFIRLGDGIYRKTNITSIVKVNENK